MKTIKLTQGKFASVDDEDFKFLNQWKWYINNKGYAVRSIKNSKIFMHRIINKTPQKFETDHIDGNPLNNQKYNLRTVNHMKNLWNIKKENRGVLWYKKTKRWRVRITVDKKQIYLGYFKDLIQAINIRKEAERRLYIYG